MKHQSTSANPLPPAVRVAILLPERVWAGSVFLVRELLLVAGTLLAKSSDAQAHALFQTQLLGATWDAVPSLSGLPIQPDAILDEATECFDIVILPTQFAPVGEVSPIDQRMVAWTVQQHRAGALIFSLSGAVLLAKTGLLNGRQATGVRSEAALFARSFPTVRFTPSCQIVAHDNIICVGGIAPTAEACAYLIQRFFGQHAAQKFTRHAGSESKNTQVELAVWGAQFRQHPDRQVLSVQACIEREIAHLPSLAQLAAQVALSERSLSRRFKHNVGMSLRQYAALCRLELAQVLLRSSQDPLIWIADACGFANTAGLVHAYSQHFGVSPQKYRQAHAPKHG